MPPSVEHGLQDPQPLWLELWSSEALLASTFTLLMPAHLPAAVVAELQTLPGGQQVCVRWECIRISCRRFRGHKCAGARRMLGDGVGCWENVGKRMNMKTLRFWQVSTDVGKAAACVLFIAVLGMCGQGFGCGLMLPPCRRSCLRGRYMWCRCLHTAHARVATRPCAVCVSIQDRGNPSMLRMCVAGAGRPQPPLRHAVARRQCLQGVPSPK